MNMKAMAIGGSLLGLVVGSVAGYLVAMRRLERNYIFELDKEVDAAKRYYSMMYKKDEFSTPSEVLQRRTKATPEGFEGETPEEVDNNANYGATKFVKTLLENRYGAPSEEPQNEEQLRDVARSKGEPYILDQNEFMTGELDYNQVTLTYFAEDHVLADEGDMPVEDPEATVGNANLDRFGYKSNDPKVVYVRNDKLEIDFEIVKSEGSYAQEVAGFTPDPPETRKRSGKSHQIRTVE